MDRRQLLSGVAEKSESDGEDLCEDIWETMLYRMNLGYSIPFPVSTIIDGDDIQAYNGVWRFLLQLKWATMALDKCHQEFLFHGRERVRLRKVQCKSAGDELWRSVNVVTFRISHFVRALQEYLMTRVVLVEWNAFASLISKPDSCTSLERAQQCHKSYLMSLQRQCLTALDKTWTVLALRLRTIIRLSFRLYKLCLALVAYSSGEWPMRAGHVRIIIRERLRWSVAAQRKKRQEAPRPSSPSFGTYLSSLRTRTAFASRPCSRCWRWDNTRIWRSCTTGS